MNQIFLNRNDILDAAKDLANGNLQAHYGEPENGRTNLTAGEHDQ